MKQRGPRDDTMEYAGGGKTDHRLAKDSITGDVHGTLAVIFFAALVVGLGILLMYLVF